MATTSNRRALLIQETVRLYVGISNVVLALDPLTGEELWRTKLDRMSTFVTVSLMGQYVYAASAGEIYCLEAATGEVIWHNELKGMGRGFVTFAGEGMIASVVPQSAAMQAQADAAA